MNGTRIARIDETDYIWQTCAGHTAYKKSFIDELFQRTWKDAEKKEVLNYNVDDIYTKILPGDYKLVLQLNEMRVAKRRAPAAVSSIKQPFDETKFNFTLVKKEEILFGLVVSKLLMNTTEEENETFNEADLMSKIIVNAAPITPFHGLLVPSPWNFKPQVLDCEGLFLGISLVLASNTPALKVGFNSLGGFASVNHYHLHVYYLPHPIYIENTACEKFAGPVYTFKDPYAPGFIFQLENEDVGKLARNCQKLIDLLLDQEICHNVMITRGIKNNNGAKESHHYDTVRVCIWARKPTYGVKEVRGFAAAMCELSGHVPIYDEDIWENVTEQDVKRMMQDTCLQPFTNLLPKVQLLFSCDQSDL